MDEGGGCGHLQRADLAVIRFRLLGYRRSFWVALVRLQATRVDSKSNCCPIEFASAHRAHRCPHALPRPFRREEVFARIKSLRTLHILYCPHIDSRLKDCRLHACSTCWQARGREGASWPASDARRVRLTLRCCFCVSIDIHTTRAHMIINICRSD